MSIHYGTGEILLSSARVPIDDPSLCHECGFWYCGIPSRHKSSCSRYEKEESKLKESK